MRQLEAQQTRRRDDAAGLPQEGAERLRDDRRAARRGAGRRSSPPSRSPSRGAAATPTTRAESWPRSAASRRWPRWGAARGGGARRAPSHRPVPLPSWQRSPRSPPRGPPARRATRRANAAAILALCAIVVAAASVPAPWGHAGVLARRRASAAPSAASRPRSPPPSRSRSTSAGAGAPSGPFEYPPALALVCAGALPGRAVRGDRAPPRAAPCPERWRRGCWSPPWH